MIAELFLGLLLLAAGSEPAARVLVHGTVRTEDGPGLPHVTVYLVAPHLIARSDGAGRFELRGDVRGQAILVATLPGFVAARRTVDLDAAPVEIDLILMPLARTEIISVLAPALGDALPFAQQRSGLDALTTPGTAGDLFRAAQMMPGVVKVDEGAGLFVRGGDVSETVTFLDRARLAHPYRYETTTGGMFGTVPPWHVSGFSLATGGFPARYGNALSGVLELTGLDPPAQRELSASVGLGAASLSGGLPLGPGAGVWLGGNRSNTRALFAVNDPEQEFSSYPEASDRSTRLHFGSPAAGWFRLFAFHEDDSVGVETQEGGFSGLLESEARNRMYSLGWERRLADCCLAGVTLSHDAFRHSSRVGAIDETQQDTGNRVRLDLAAVSGRWTWRFGGEWESEQVRLDGSTSVRGGDLGGVEGARRWQLDATRRRGAGYVEMERRLGPVTVEAGGRLDYHSWQDSWTGDPRAALRWQVASDHRLRLAWGIYHQSPDARYLDAQRGNPDLDIMNAEHWVLGYGFRDPMDPFHLRVELYAKDYDSLPLENERRFFSSDGTGEAHGLDLFARLAAGRWDGWVSYSYLHARRRWTRWEDQGRYPVPRHPVSPDFEIPHTLQLSANVQLPASVTLATSVRVASGRPFTPVEEAESTEDGFVPIYGAPQSERYPTYRRLDVTVSRAWPLPGENLAVGYVGITNLLDRQNIFEYAYTEDYDSREPARSSFGRALYFGVTFQLSADGGSNP